MIKVEGQAERTFLFPAGLDKTFEFFSDISRLIGYLPHITLLDEAPANCHLRVQYATTELGAYLINIVSDLEYRIDLPNYAFEIRPVDRLPAIKPRTTVNSTSARGYFTCNARFLLGDGPEETCIVYQLSLHARLPTPGGLRFMPGRVVSSIASGITNGRIKEIADGFVTNSTKAYRAGLAAKST